MSLKNYIFTSVATKHPISSNGDGDGGGVGTIDEEDRSNASPRSNIGLPEEVDVLATQLNWLSKAWKFVSVEPVMVCWLLPSCLLYIAIENLALEKSCRVNFHYSKIVCDNMIDKSINNIDCVEVRSRMNADNVTDILGNATSTVISLIQDLQYNTTLTRSELEVMVCNAEVDSQILDSSLNVYTAPFDSVFGILIILFAGGWSDRTGRRKPCMLLPLVGELAALIVMLIATVFMKQLPLEFSSILMKLLPAVTGGANLMLMGVYSYLTEMTAVKDRTFRFGIFAAFVPLIPILSIPFSGILFQKLRYIKLIMLCIPINIIGILYIVFVLKEAGDQSKSELDEVTTAVESTTTSSATLANNELQADIDQHRSYHMNGNRGRRSTVHVIKEKIERNFFVQFFNPVVAIGCIQLVVKKREFHGRRVLIILLVTYFIAVGPGFGEEPNEYNFTRIKLNWDGLVYSPFATYGNAVSLVGTIIMVGCISKLCYVSDPMVGIMSSLCSAVSRILFAAASTSSMMYFARTVDMFVSVRGLALKSIISTFVENAELGRIFSIIGIIEAFGKFVFVSTYSIIYKYTLETWPGAFYICSFLCLCVTTVLFVFLYIIVRKKNRREAANRTAEEASTKTETVDIKTSDNNSSQN